MSQASADIEKPRSLISFGLWGTAAWLLVVLIYALLSSQSFVDLRPNEFGDFLAGTFAPLAFLWLVVGLLQQGQELRLQYQELKKSVDQYQEQAVALKGSERNARLALVYSTRDWFEYDLALIIDSILAHSGDSAQRNKEWDQYSNGDRNVFFRRLLSQPNSYFDTIKNDNKIKQLMIAYDDLYGKCVEDLTNLSGNDFYQKFYSESDFGAVKEKLSVILRN